MREILDVDFCHCQITTKIRKYIPPELVFPIRERIIAVLRGTMMKQYVEFFFKYRNESIVGP